MDEDIGRGTGKAMEKCILRGLPEYPLKPIAYEKKTCSINAG
jgi:hypothetical protein